ncbi:4-alpha-glucanotransferase [Lacrimispora amygdalina]|uniref:4-alpha-glucanotransferase n=1 Tax=Lacrimispora amygdalina TaxID=253257 RepID=A0A3E2NIL8_9FIRM|nr:4-alpha-glucanotransferase [Clostridium indicum]RFZ80839.1 4-alpha-glucanotransferase [Clostridium indicum]
MRKCGMLLPVSGLPSKYGIGAFSKEAYEWIDLLKKAGQHYWQILPLGPTGYGDSPYQSFSSFAGNPYFIDLEELVREHLISEEQCDLQDIGDDPSSVDYEKIYESRYPLLRQAYESWKDKGNSAGEFQETLGGETVWYCFYMALKDHFQGKSWIDWDEDIRLKQDAAVEYYKKTLSDETGFYIFLQVKFWEQWEKLKAYAGEQGIRIIGDLPIYVAFDSADAWGHPELFQFDESGYPEAVAGCPPDAFAAAGQLWGNPLYRWDYHKETGYEWWMKRLEYSFRLYDTVRVDHFRGFDEYYRVPAGREDAMVGTWEKGPGIQLFQRLREKFGNLDIIAEDLGFLTPSVLNLLSETGLPGMKVLEFAFDANGESIYLPHNYSKNCVVYTGTHDNQTLRSWYEDLSEADRNFSHRYLNNWNTPYDEVHWDFIRLALASVADLAVIPVQDYLGTGRNGRINEPSTLGNNWKWRLKQGEITEDLINKCRELALLYGRK